jgi:hypothetical protein
MVNLNIILARISMCSSCATSDVIIDRQMFRWIEWASVASPVTEVNYQVYLPWEGGVMKNF